MDRTKRTAYILKSISPVPSSGNRLTAITTFLNEGEEVINTVRSIREFAGDLVDIIVINDHSYDGYDYYHELVPYHVHYFYNHKRKGVAASRDLGVNLCSTPYFLLLDAHMRFYDALWVGKINQLLDENDRCILCCQTKTLNKDKQGRVFEKRNVPISYGAYIPFMKNNYLPDIKWKSKEDCPEKSIEPIPAVLGAGYAASKRYWNYIRGLEGLMMYGCDEAYLSLKVWLEGGQCLLLKGVVIGHIYRKESPYVVPSMEFVYNYLLISSLLFPEKLRILSFAIAQCVNRKTFDEAIQLLAERNELLKELKEYYLQIFTVPFEEVLNRNRVIDIEQEKDVFRKRDLLPLIANFLVQKEDTTDLGIVDGLMNDVLFFFHYAHFTQEEQWRKHAHILLDRALKRLDTQELSLDFQDGLCGIGWGLIYLQRQGFLAGEMIEKHLQQIDKVLLQTNLEDIYTLSFLQGIGGVMEYWVARILYLNKQGQALSLDENFIDCMQIKAEEILQQSNNVFMVNIASQFSYIMNHKKELTSIQYAPSIHDWTNFPSFLAKNPQYWKSGLSGCTGAGLLTMLVLNYNK